MMLNVCLVSQQIDLAFLKDMYIACCFSFQNTELKSPDAEKGWIYSNIVYWLNLVNCVITQSAVSYFHTLAGSVSEQPAEVRPLLYGWFAVVAILNWTDRNR